MTIHKLQLNGRQYEWVITHTRKVLAVLDVQYQRGELCLWALVGDEPVADTISVKILATGQPIKQGMLTGYYHAATVQDGEFVWHVFVDRQPCP